MKGLTQIQNASQTTENSFKENITLSEREKRDKVAFVLFSTFQKKFIHVSIEIKKPNLDFSELGNFLPGL
jgi:hypothetical protein